MILCVVGWRIKWKRTCNVKWKRSFLGGILNLNGGIDHLGMRLACEVKKTYSELVSGFSDLSSAQFREMIWY